MLLIVFLDSLLQGVVNPYEARYIFVLPYFQTCCQKPHILPSQSRVAGQMYAHEGSRLPHAVPDLPDDVRA